MDTSEMLKQLQQNLQSLKEIISLSEDKNHVHGRKTSNATRTSIQSGFAKTSDESTTSSKTIGLVPPSLSGSCRAEFSLDEQQDIYKILSRCLKQKLGFLEEKPVAAAFIYRCLVHWDSFEVENTAFLDFIIEGINDVLKVGNENDTLPYWLTNTSALMCLVQRNLRSLGSLSADSQRSVGSGGLNGRFNHGPAVMFEQQLTACLENIFASIRDNFKKEISPLLHLGTESLSWISRPSDNEVMQQLINSHWFNIIKFLDSFMSRLRENHVPSFFIRKLIAQAFSFINVSLFNSLLLRRECCTFSNGNYMKWGLAELEHWITKSKEEFAGTFRDELNYTKQAVLFLVIYQKSKKSLREITQDLCPALTMEQIYRITTMYRDDKYGTRSVSDEVVAEMRETITKNSQDSTPVPLLLDEDLSIPFSREDIFMELSAIEPQLCNFPSSHPKGPKPPLQYLGLDLEGGLPHMEMEVKYPAIMFEEQLTACLEKIFALICDNFRKHMSSLLCLCMKAPRNRIRPSDVMQPGSNCPWDIVTKALDSLLSCFHENHVPSIFIRKLIIRVFSFINVALFNSVLLRRECCTFSYGEYMKSGLAELKRWLVNSKEEFTGTSWHELNHIRQAAKFLVIHQKRKKSLMEIKQGVCPALTIEQIHRISTMYWDDKYGTQSVSNKVLAEMRETFTKNSDSAPGSFLLVEDLSFPFSKEDINKALSAK